MTVLNKTLKSIYSATIDRSGFREVASRYIVFVLPILFWGRTPYWWGLSFTILGILIRAWAAGTLQKDLVMAHSGPYLLFRHPLYLGSCLLSLGLLVTLHHWFATVTLFLLTAATYVHQIKHEEENLENRFGESYRVYQRQVGPLWPKAEGIKLFLKEKSQFSWKTYLKNKEYECLLGVIAVFGMIWISSRS